MNELEILDWNIHVSMYSSDGSLNKPYFVLLEVWFSLLSCGESILAIKKKKSFMDCVVFSSEKMQCIVSLAVPQSCKLFSLVYLLFTFVVLVTKHNLFLYVYYSQTLWVKAAKFLPIINSYFHLDLTFWRSLTLN